jgi:hypothetical protein
MQDTVYEPHRRRTQGVRCGVIVLALLVFWLGVEYHGRCQWEHLLPTPPFFHVHDVPDLTWMAPVLYAYIHASDGASLTSI